MASVETAATAAFLVSDQLADAAIPYAISGAVALAVHGVPRMTSDVDVTVDATPAQLDHVFDALERAGCLFEREQARRELAAASFFTARCGRVRVDVFVSFHPHHDAASARRVAVEGPDGRARWYSSAEDLAIHKLAMLRPKDHMDLEHLFAAQGPNLDVAYVRRWVEAIAPDPADRRRALLEDLLRRFTPRG